MEFNLEAKMVANYYYAKILESIGQDYLGNESLQKEGHYTRRW